MNDKANEFDFKKALDLLRYVDKVRDTLFRKALKIVNLGLDTVIYFKPHLYSE